MKLYFDYSKIDRKKSDEYFSKANEIMKEIDPEWQKAHDRLKELMQRENLEKLNANSYRQNNLFELHQEQFEKHLYQ